MLPVTIVYFCYGWTLWLYLNWLPHFSCRSTSSTSGSSAMFASTVFFAGVGGDLLGGSISDRSCGGRATCAAPAATWSSSAFSARRCLVPVFLTRDLTRDRDQPGGAFFFAELVIGPMWAIPMDIAPKYSGTASGLMNTGSALAAILSPMAFGYIADADRRLAPAVSRLAGPAARSARPARFHDASRNEAALHLVIW